MVQQCRRRERRPNKPGLGVASVLLIAIGLVGKLCTTNGASTVHRQRNAALGKSTITPAQLYFDAVAPEDRENFIKYHLDRALVGRLPHHTSSIPKDFEFVTFQQNQIESHQQDAGSLLNLLEASNGTKPSSPVVVGSTFIRYSIVCYRSGCIDTSDIARPKVRMLLTAPLPRLQDALEPEHFSTNLLDHFMIAYGLSEVDVYAFVALNVICFPSGWCFNPDDVGNICCPF